MKSAAANDSFFGAYVYYDRQKKEPVSNVEIQVFLLDEVTPVGSPGKTNTKGFVAVPPEKLEHGTYSVRAKFGETIRWQRNITTIQGSMKTVYFQQFPKPKDVGAVKTTAYINT